MKKLLIHSFLVAIACASTAAQAQVMTQPENVLQLSATGQVDVQQDWLTISLSTTREGSDAATVQNQLKVALDAALTEARKAAQPGQVEVRTGAFSLYPRYNQGGKIGSWQGTAELVIEGRDFARITQLAGRINTLTIGGVGFSLSREQRAKVEGDAQLLAIQRFRAKAAELAKGFGFGNYTLREVSVNSNDFGIPRMRMQAGEVAVAASAMPVPVEAGKSTVNVTVSGSVQLR